MTEQVSEAASMLAARRVVETKECAICGTEFEGLRTAKYCSARCRWKNWYVKNKKKGEPC